MSQIFLPKAYLRGEIVNFKDAKVSIATHALHYGTAAFGGMRAYPDNAGNILFFRPELHIARLAQSAKLLGFDFDKDQIKQALQLFVESNPKDKPYYMRPLVYASDLGVAPRLHDVESDLLIYGVEMGDYLAKDGGGISCCFSSWTRGEDRSLPLRGKISGTYVSSALAKTEAVERGFDEAIFLNSRGKIAEGSAMNIFIVRDDTLITPAITNDILEGITRRSVIEIAQSLDIKVEEREVDKSELVVADELFLTGTAAQIAPISKIEQYKLNRQNPITAKIQMAMRQILEGHPTDFNWLKPLI